MDVLSFLLKLVVVVAGGWLMTTRAIPWIFVRLARLVGFRAKITPVTRRRVDRFKRIKRGYWAFRLLSTLFVISLFLEVIVSGRALVVVYDGEVAFPAVAEWVDNAAFFTDVNTFNKASDFGQIGESEVDYRQFDEWSEDPGALRSEIANRTADADADAAEIAASAPTADDKEWKHKAHQRKVTKLEKRRGEIETLTANLDVFENGTAFAVMPLYPYSPSEFRHEFEKNPPNKPSFSTGLLLGTDVSGRDLVPLMAYAFRISLSFALIVAFVGYFVGIIVGGVQGYFGGWTDILSQRFVEIWGSIPFLFTIMIIASILRPSFLILVGLLILLRAWLGITYYVRGEFYREKSKDYVHAAIASGVSDRKIILKHILPNSIVPIVTFAPFAIVGYVNALVSLDFLGFGLPAGTPSWGGLLRQGLENITFYPHLVIAPVVALALTLYCVVMIGEAVREAFDPKVFSRLR